jgi:hypothetical protein
MIYSFTILPQFVSFLQFTSRDQACVIGSLL